MLPPASLQCPHNCKLLLSVVDGKLGVSSQISLMVPWSTPSVALKVLRFNEMRSSKAIRWIHVEAVMNPVVLYYVSIIGKPVNLLDTTTGKHLYKCQLKHNEDSPAAMVHDCLAAARRTPSCRYYNSYYLALKMLKLVESTYQPLSTFEWSGLPESRVKNEVKRCCKSAAKSSLKFRSAGLERESEFRAFPWFW